MSTVDDASQQDLSPRELEIQKNIDSLSSIAVFSEDEDVQSRELQVIRVIACLPESWQKTVIGEQEWFRSKADPKSIYRRGGLIWGWEESGWTKNAYAFQSGWIESILIATYDINAITGQGPLKQIELEVNNADRILNHAESISKLAQTLLTGKSENESYVKIVDAICESYGFNDNQRVELAKALDQYGELMVQSAVNLKAARVSFHSAMGVRVIMEEVN